MINKRLPVVSLIFYILAGLFLIFAVWAAVIYIQDISTAVSMGQVVVRDNLFYITNFLMTSLGQFVVFAALLFGVGWIVNLFAGIEVEAYDYVDEDHESMDDLLEDLENELDEE